MDPLGCSTCWEPLHRDFTVAKPKSPILTVQPSWRKISSNRVQDSSQVMDGTRRLFYNSNNTMLQIVIVKKLAPPQQIVCPLSYQCSTPLHNTTPFCFLHRVMTIKCFQELILKFLNLKNVQKLCLLLVVFCAADCTANYHCNHI